MKLTLTFLSVLVGFCSVLNAQKPSFTFSDTYPTNNVDSLENWLKTHPQPTEERLKNLIKLERTYYWGYLFKLGTSLKEIDALSKSLKNTKGTSCHNYIKALLASAQNESAVSVTSANKALIVFQNVANPDYSAMLHCYAVFVLNNSTIYGNQVVSDPKFSAGYIKTMNDLLLKTNSPHDKLMARLAYTRYLYGQGGDGIKELRPTAEAALKIIKTNTDCQYATYRFNRLKAIGYQIEGKPEKSYATNKAVLRDLHPNQEWEVATVGYNLATDCYIMKRVDEGITYCQKNIQTLHKKPRFWFGLAGPYTKYRELLMLKGDYKEANNLADSMSKYNSLNFVTENDNKMLELQGRYEFERNQNQISVLKQEAQRNLLLLGIAAFFVVIVGALGYWLYKANQLLKKSEKARDQLFGIVAHDLRRPMYAFQGIKALVGFHLRKQDYAAIEKLSVAIDESGVRLQKMLDNLVAWAMSQQESLPYQPEDLLLHERVQDIVTLYAGVNFLKKVSFEVNIAENLTAYADPNAFDLVVRNLIDNSFKALHQAGNIRISAQAEATNILVEFTDDAGGMPSQKVALIQRVFDAPEKAQVGENGMGMGLITIGRFVQRNGGSLHVESQEGKGAKFIVRLPAEKGI